MDGKEWNQTIAQLPNPHLLQTWEWGTVKNAYGWQPAPQIFRDETGRVSGAAQILQRRAAPLPYKVLYASRGPLLDWSDAKARELTLTGLENYARKQHAIFLKIDPEVLLGTGVLGSVDAVENPVGLELQNELLRRGWRYSSEQVQFRNTSMIDLTESEEDWLGRLKQKARYNLRLGEKRGVTVRVGSEADFMQLYRMYAETSVRDQFLIRTQEYYFRLWQTFYQINGLEPLIAEVDGEAIAAIMVFYFADKAWYMQGMSRDLHREKMPNYLLQWTAIRQARARGCKSYDLWGAPERFDEGDRLWGVYRFKEAIGGKVVRTLGAWDYPVQLPLYHFYMSLLPRILNVMRRFGRERTRQEVLG